MKPFNVHGRWIDVRYVSGLENSGEYHSAEKLIKICKTQSKELQRLALLHEFVHAVCDRCGITQAIPTELEEVICEAISHAFHENFNLRRK